MAEILEFQYLTLSLGDERYAIPVGRVLEVVEHTRVTRLPRTAAFMKGLIDLRGRGVPVMDLRLRFGMAETELTRDTAIVVIELNAREGRTVVGLLADAVHEVVEIRPERVEKAPSFGAGPAADFLRGVGRLEESFVLILDIDRIFDAEDTDLAAELAVGEA